MEFDDFNIAYRALTGHDGACRWQYRLFRDLEAGRFPTDVELATGLGKTSIIALWVLALSRMITRPLCPIPRRLAYVVDRRVVVDQASEFAEDIRKRLEEAIDDSNHPLYVVASSLCSAGCGPGVLGTSTLRGQRTQDTRWRDDPSRPAIIVGTVDMIGSRLLFSAYGRVGPWGRSLEAGLLGHDCLVVLDEAHLCSPFAATLAAIERHQKRIAPFSVIRMGATMAPVTDILARTPGLPSTAIRDVDAQGNRERFDLQPDEILEKKVADRLRASKVISLAVASASPGEQLAEWAMEKAAQEPGASIGIVLNTVAEARRCTSYLKSELHRNGNSGESDVVSITGSMRGWDRDMITESAQYARFRSGRERYVETVGSTFLVATSCIEVGADIDCDHLGVEVCAADSLLQRLGRVNRLGLRREMEGLPSSVLVVGKPLEDTTAGRVFLRLQELAEGEGLSGAAADLPGRLLDGSDSARGLLEMRVPPPALTPAVLDDLAMTSKYPKTGVRVDVSRWLHGSVEEASLYIEVAWRDELDWITDLEGGKRLLKAFPIAPRETARCPLYEAVEVLGAVRDNATANPRLGNCAIFFIRDGMPEGQPLCSLPREGSALRQLIDNAIVVLPASAGGYDGHFVDHSTQSPVVDIAEKAQPSNRAQRRRLRVRAGQLSHAGEGSSDVWLDPETTEEDLLTESIEAVKTLFGLSWRVIESAGNGQIGVLIVRENRTTVERADDDEASLGFRQPVLLDQHLADARDKARRLCELLHVSLSIRLAVVEAAANHDLGKNCPWWQRAVGRLEKPPVAKSGQARFDHGINRGYRHEIGSVASLQRLHTGSTIEESASDLCLHLVAAHHGHARPGFRCEAAGPVRADGLEQVLTDTPPRFARVQRSHGWWGLAWLEALVKAADALASTEGECQ